MNVFIPYILEPTAYSSESYQLSDNREQTPQNVNETKPKKRICNPSIYPVLCIISFSCKISTTTRLCNQIITHKR